MTVSGTPGDITAPADKKSSFLVVGIGASAGGVQALQTFFEHAPEKSGIAYVVVLHLAPDYDSQLAEVLRVVTTIPVVKLSERVHIAPDTIYVVSPNSHLTMMDGIIEVSPNITIEERRAPVDIFFRTLAESHAERALCVVLSGTGANGSMGLKRVKERGGVAFVQNPREAQFGEMPRNSIATDLVDGILNVADMPEKIIAYRDSLGKVDIVLHPEKRPEDDQQSLREIFTQLRTRTGHDFANYKRATILRRIQRRISVKELPSLQAYAKYLNDTPEEAHALLKDLLISVTNFFRDKEAFDYLDREIIPRLLEGKLSDASVRVWIAGCATGEEAYSLAMMLAERTMGMVDAPRVQLFASDIDENAIAIAREGLYTLNDAADVLPDRLRRFFNTETDGYRVKREIREMILFANHNLIKDPPFSHVDMITCRNLLIYFNSTAQERVMETVHFALNPGGYLFLGSSESVNGATDLFMQVSKEANVYQSRPITTRIAYPVPESTPSFRFIKENVRTNEMGMETRENRSRERMTFGDLHQQLLEKYAPPSVIINEEYDIVHLSEKAGRYLQVSGGEPTQNLLKLIKPDLRLEVRTALYQAVQQQTNVRAANLTVRIEDHIETVDVHIRPVITEENGTRGFILVIFETVTDAGQKENIPYAAPEPVARQLEDELIKVKTQLRVSAEQFEVQAEELKASNEELQAMNEELRSAAEELETSKEELQSINEELVTVNQELKVKIEELSQTNNNFQNLVNSADIPTIFLDRHFHVSIFTPAAREIFNLIPYDIGRPISDITNRLAYKGLIADAEMVLLKLTGIEREVKTADDKTYLLRITPYRTSEDRISGVVIVFINITERIVAEAAVRDAEARERQERRRLETILNEMPTGVIITNDKGEVIYHNRQLEQVFRHPLRPTLNSEGFSDWQLFELDSDVPLHNDHLPMTRTLRKGETITGMEAKILRGDGSFGYVIINTVPIKDEEGNVIYGVANFMDTTDKRAAEEALQYSETKLRIVVKASRIGTWIWNIGENKYEPDEHTLEMFNNPPDGLSRIDQVASHVYKPDLSVFTDAVTRAADPKGIGVLNAEFRITNQDGSVRWLCSVGQTFFEGEPKRAIMMVGSNTDITTRKEAESVLRQSEERYKAIFNQATAGVAEYDTQGRHILVNDTLCSLLGYSAEELKEMNLSGITYAEDYPHCLDLFEKAVATGQSFTSEKRYVRIDGELLWIAESISAIKDADGKTQSILSVGIEITDRKKTEIFMRESAERYRIALEAGELATWDWNLKTDKVNWSKQHFLLFGADYTEDSIDSTYFLEFIYPEDLALVKQQLAEVLSEKGIYSAEFRVRRKDNGKLRWMTGYGRVTEREDGKPVRVSGVIFDSTQRRESADDLEATKNSLNTALEAAKMGVWSIDMTHGSIDRSAKHDELLGYPAWQEEWSQEKAKQNILDEDKPKYDAAFKNLLTEGVFNLEARVKNIDGSICWIHYYGRTFRNEDGKGETAAGVIFDITDQKTVEKQKDEFIGVASHELKTPVTSIKAYAEILQEMFTEKKDYQSAELMGKLDSQVNRLTNLIKDLLDVTKISEGQLHLTTTGFDMEAMIRDVAEDMQRTTRQHRIRLTISPLPEAVGDKERLAQVLINMLSNAIKYSPGTKEVIVEASYVDNNIRISVQDFGIGMSPGTQDRLFSRFFRSDNPNIRSFPGLGLGLFISMEIMKRHNGTISVQSEREQGSVFTMILPVV